MQSSSIFLKVPSVQSDKIYKPFKTKYTSRETVHCKKELAIFPSQAGMSLTKLSLAGKKPNYSRPGRV
jgi:hypothetical protein